MSPLTRFLGSNIKNLFFVATKSFYLLIMSWFKSCKFFRALVLVVQPETLGSAVLQMSPIISCLPTLAKRS